MSQSLSPSLTPMLGIDKWKISNLTEFVMEDMQSEENCHNWKFSGGFCMASAKQIFANKHI